MSWQLTPYVVPLLLTAAISVAAAVYVWVTRHQIPRSRMAVLLLVAGAIWMLGTAFESASTDLATKTFWDKLQYVGICIIPAAWLVFTLHYTGRDRWLTSIGRIQISIVPLVTFLLILSNEAHGLIWQDAWLDTSGRFAVRRTIYGPAMWAFLAYSYTVLMVGIFFVVQELVRAGRLRRWQATAVLLAVTAPLMLSILEQAPGQSGQGQMEGTPLALGLILPIVAWSFYRLRVRDIVPVARDAVIESMGDALLVLDPQHRVVDHNPAAGQLMGAEGGKVKGQPLGDIWPEAASQLLALAGQAESGRIAVLARDDSRRTYDARVFPVTNWRGRTASQAVVLRDITQQASAEAKIAASLDEQRVLLQSSAVLTSSLDLGEVLLGLAEQLLLVSGCHICLIHEWDRDPGQVRALAEHTRAFWPSGGGDSHRLADYPTTAQILRNGKPALVSNGMDDPELDLMAESGTSELLMLPLRAGKEIVGLVELSSVNPGTLGETCLTVCEPILQEFASGLATPVWANSSGLLLDIAHLLVRRTGAQSCSISDWSRESDTVTTVAEYADLSWTASNGPCTRMADWPSSARALVEGKSTITRLSDPDGDSVDQRELLRWGGHTVVTVPMSAKGEPIGMVELFDVLEEQTIDDGQIRLWRALVDQAAIAIENARLHAQAQAQLARQTALREAVSAISSALDLQTVLTRIVEQMGQAVNATSGYISGYDPETRLASVLAEWVGPEACEAEQESDLGVDYPEEAEVEWLEIMHAGRHDISHIDGENSTQAERRHMQRFGAKTILYIPLRIKGQLLGYVEIWESRHKREFLPDEIALCHDIAQSAAVAIENARLYEQAQQEIAERRQVEAAMLQRNRELVSLQAAVAATASNLDRQFVLDTVTWEMASLLEVEDCSVLEWDQAANTVSVIAEYRSTSWSEGPHQAEVLDLADHPLRSQVLAERVARQTAGAQDNPGSAELTFRQQTNGSALLILPLMFHDRVVGLVEITDSNVGREFNDREVSLAQMLANQAATAIENARLYEQAQTEISIRREAEKSLEQYADELERSNQDLQQFAYVASHDLQEPLRMVTSYLQLLQRRYQGQLDADADDFIHFATDGADRMRELIRGLLAYSRVGTLGAPLQPIDCQEVLDRTLDSLQVALAESDAQVTYHPLPTVTADATQLGQLLQNLIGNAVKFRGDRRPEIHISVEERDGEYLFSVRDNGIGIEPQYAERIFAIFQRLHTRDEYPGTGIGLAVCKRIVERHGGRIWVESQAGKGSTFFFTIADGR